MELTEQERDLEKSTAKACIGLCVGLVGLAILVKVPWERLSIFILAGLFALFIIYLLLPCECKRKGFLKKAAEVRTENLALLVGFGVLGISLQDKVCMILGAVCWVLGIFIFLYCTWKGAKRRQEMGTKGRKNPSSKK